MMDINLIPGKKDIKREVLQKETGAELVIKIPEKFFLFNYLFT